MTAQQYVHNTPEYGVAKTAMGDWFRKTPESEAHMRKQNEIELATKSTGAVEHLLSYDQKRDEYILRSKTAAVTTLNNSGAYANTVINGGYGVAQGGHINYVTEPNTVSQKELKAALAEMRIELMQQVCDEVSRIEEVIMAALDRE